MNERLRAWLDVLQAGGGGGAAWHNALAHFGSIEALRNAPAHTLAAAGIGNESLRALQRPDAGRIEAWQRWLETPQHALVTLDDPGYPSRLRELPGAPLALWLRGAQPELLETPALAIVGSRNATAGGIANARAFASAFGHSGLTVLSGLASGIDAAAHRGALGTTGGTLAVLGNGIDNVYPRENAGLGQQIAAAGLLISEYAPGTPAARFRFPERNRIIAGLSFGVLVVEAGSRSGSLITARLAGEFGRDVFAIPGSIHNPLSRGCHQLIRQGARLVETADDVLVELAPALRQALSVPERGGSPPRAGAESSEKTAAQRATALGPEYQKLLEAIGFDPMNINEILAEATLTTAEVSSMLLLLELEGYVEALPGGRYMRIS